MAELFTRYNTIACILAILCLFASPTQAARFFTNSTVPSNLTQACTVALLAEVSCSPAVPALQLGTFYPKTQLEFVFSLYITAEFK